MKEIEVDNEENDIFVFLFRNRVCSLFCCYEINGVFIIDGI